MEGRSNLPEEPVLTRLLSYNTKSGKFITNKEMILKCVKYFVFAFFWAICVKKKKDRSKIVWFRISNSLASVYTIHQSLSQKRRRRMLWVIC